MPWKWPNSPCCGLLWSKMNAPYGHCPTQHSSLRCVAWWPQAPSEASPMRSASEEWAAGTVAIATIDCDSLMKFGTHLHFGTSVLPTNVSIRFTNITGYVTHNVTAASQKTAPVRYTFVLFMAHLATLSVGLPVNTELKGCGRKKSWLI